MRRPSRTSHRRIRDQTDKLKLQKILVRKIPQLGRRGKPAESDQSPRKHFSSAADRFKEALRRTFHDLLRIRRDGSPGERSVNAVELG